MYRCTDCKEVFVYPDEKDLGPEPYEFWGQRGYRRMVVWACPECDGDDIVHRDEQAEAEARAEAEAEDDE